MQAVVADLAEQSRRAPDRPTNCGPCWPHWPTWPACFSARSRTGWPRHWLAWLPSALSDDPRGPRPTDAVTLCSFHRAKGLEWEAVWVAGLEQGLVPIGRATTPAAEAEERRLLYVALTRAGAELHCSWARQRTFGIRPVPREASPWLELILAASGDPAPGDPRPSADAPRWRQRLRDQRRQLGGRRRVAGRRAVDGRRAGPSQTPTWCATPGLASGGGPGRRDSGLRGAARRHPGSAGLAAPRTTEELLTVPGLGPSRPVATVRPCCRCSPTGLRPAEARAGGREAAPDSSGWQSLRTCRGGAIRASRRRAVSAWYSIEVFDGATPASVWGEAYRDSLMETALTHGATDWSWHRHTWGVVFEVSFDDEPAWESFTNLPAGAGRPGRRPGSGHRPDRVSRSGRQLGGVVPPPAPAPDRLGLGRPPPAVGSRAATSCSAVSSLGLPHPSLVGAQS